jgi:hypothetical protein
LIVLESLKNIYIEERHKAENGNYYLVHSQYGDNKPNRWAILADEIFLGEYSSEAKAIKVLDAIENAYKNVESNYKAADDTYWQSIRDACLVFQMPSDDEAEG